MVRFYSISPDNLSHQWVINSKLFHYNKLKSILRGTDTIVRKVEYKFIFSASWWNLSLHIQIK